MQYQNWYYWNIDKIVTIKDKEVFIPTGYTKFVNICKKIKTVKEEIKWKRYGGQWCRIRLGYNIDLATYQKAKEEFDKIKQIGKEKWENYPNILKIIDILKKAFNANSGAKNVEIRAIKQNLYDKKDTFMSKAISLAKNINLPFFFWGCQIDPDCINYNVVLYFQFGDEQVSFHTSDISSAPEFKGKWVGYEQYKFPLSVRKIRKMLKDHNIEFKKVKEIESILPESENNYCSWESEKQYTPRYHSHNYGYCRDDFDYDNDEFDDYGYY